MLDLKFLVRGVETQDDSASASNPIVRGHPLGRVGSEQCYSVSGSHSFVHQTRSHEIYAIEKLPVGMALSTIYQGGFLRQIRSCSIDNVRDIHVRVLYLLCTDLMTAHLGR